MSYEVDYKVTGAADLEAKLVALGQATGAKLLARATRRAMKPVLVDAKALAPQPGVNPYATGALRDALRLATTKPKNSDTVAATGIATHGGRVTEEITVDVGGVTEVRKITRRLRAPHWHFIELGIKSRKIDAKPYMRPAFYKNIQRMLAIVSVDLEKAIARAAKGKKP